MVSFDFDAQKSDHPGYCCERAPWALVTGVEPLNLNRGGHAENGADCHEQLPMEQDATNAENGAADKPFLLISTAFHRHS